MSKENGVTVSSTSLNDGRLLTHLLLEEAAANSIHDLHSEHNPEMSDDRNLQNMIENMIGSYQSHVLQQQRQDFRFYQPKTQQNTQPSISHSQPELRWNDVHPSDPRETNEWTHAIINPTGPNGIIQEHKVSTVVLKTSDVQALRNENAMLKQTVDVLQRKANKMKQLEVAYERIEKDFDQVLTQREKQEKLEKTAIMKMEQQIQNLTSENELLRQQLERLNFQPMNQPNFDSQAMQAQAEQVMQLNILLNEIISQNKELMALKEAQNVTLEEQRNHIDMLEKALANAQERIAAKDRQAMDAAAVVDKCSHLQKLLQEAVEEKKKIQEEFGKDKAHLEMELTQVKMHMAKEGLNKKVNCSIDHDDYAMLKRDLATKDERICYLENRIKEIQKEHDGALKRVKSMTRGDTEAILAKIQKLEAEKTEKERRILELLDEKKHIQDLWSDERRTLDLRVRLLEEDLRRIVNGSGFRYPGTTTSYDAVYPSSSSMGDLASKGSTVSVYNDPMAKMEELRLRIAERRSSSGSWYFGGMKTKAKEYLGSNHARRSSGGSPSVDHLRTISMPTEYQAETLPCHSKSNFESRPEHDAQKSLDLLKQQKQITEYIEQKIASLPPATRRRFEAAAHISSLNDTRPSLSGIQMGTSNIKKVLREKSLDKNRVPAIDAKNDEKLRFEEKATNPYQIHNSSKKPTFASEARRRGTIARSFSFEDDDPNLPIATDTEKETKNLEVLEKEAKRNSLTTCTIVEVNKEKLQLNSKIADRRHSMDEDRKNLEKSRVEGIV